MVDEALLFFITSLISCNFFICVLFILFLQFPRHSHWRKIANLRNSPEFEHSFHEIRDVMKNSKQQIIMIL
jgi:hypothetical protein